MNGKLVGWVIPVLLWLCLGINSSVGDEKLETDEESKEFKVLYEDILDSKRIGSDSGSLNNEVDRNFNSEVDEEMVRKAEKDADRDLIGGLNMILKNQETLEDVLRMEGVTKLP